jgi:coenzyme F420-reducing hydrogenase alpha subunit
MHERRIEVDQLARVEGEGALDLVMEGERIVDLKFRIFEPPRFFEALLRGRSYLEVPDITARICGICPVAYQTSSANAMESLLGIEVSGENRLLRRLLYLGEWIESHALHLYLLHAPDFLGYESGIHLAKDHPDEVRRGLRLKAAGNAIMTAIGGREIHPVNFRVGGFYRSPSRAELQTLVPELEWALQAAEETVAWVSAFSFPDLDVDYELVALRHPDEYAVIDGRVVSSRGLELAVEEWEQAFEEEQVEWSNALHARVRGRGSYQVGPLARFNLNFEQLHPLAGRAAERAGIAGGVRNPFRSIQVRAVEMVHAAATGLELIEAYRSPPEPYREAAPKAGSGHGASEAPRGLLYHGYRLDAEGTILEARIVPPTSQNQLRIEDDLRLLIPSISHLSDGDLQWRLEQMIRNYDPCISCATHFLDFQRRQL